MPTYLHTNTAQVSTPPPLSPPIPDVKVGPKSAVATFAAPGQGVKVVSLQAVASKKFKTGEGASSRRSY